MLGLLLLQVLASCLWLGHSEVVKSFAECPQFFYAETTPSDDLTPKNPAWICQRYNNSYHYATLYDRDKRIPVYSAYKYQPEEVKRPHKWWFVEPQLIGKNNLKEMEREVVLIQHNFTLDEIQKSQAVNADYNVTGFDRGHLCPTGHMDTKEGKTATFTLTNAVPQGSILNNGRWNNYEHQTMIEETKGCTSTYVITGAVPGNTYISNKRVNVPSHIWSAACCLVDEEPADAWGAIAENDKNEVVVLRLGDLEKRLTELYKVKTITLFNNTCPRK
ncbi:endonuclease domain-containing 1 protein-like [Motacilla alba alba]|uniref:endonuclease domain-containing 1 protein-like n=1 Tax=Motacilla alba alba TaxID=1094192 RepID=UPI0018D57E11|nr:endonuclease domain-containing 1 protein-like [Motacilla alba alba]